MKFHEDEKGGSAQCNLKTVQKTRSNRYLNYLSELAALIVIYFVTKQLETTGRHLDLVSDDWCQLKTFVPKLMKSQNYNQSCDICFIRKCLSDKALYVMCVIYIFVLST